MGVPLRRDREACASSDSGERAGDDALASLHREHYRSLVRLATLVLGDVGLAEQVVQDAFVKLHLRWGGLRERDKAPAYLRSVVLNGARSQLRHHKVRDRFVSRRTVAPAAASATPETALLEVDGHERVVAALRALPVRQREAVVLRYYLDLPTAEIAETMGVSAGSVKTHLHRGLAALGRTLEPPGEDAGEAGDAVAAADPGGTRRTGEADGTDEPQETAP